MANGKNVRVHLINSIHVDPARAGSYSDFERDIREQLEASTRKFEKLKTTISNLVRFTHDIRGFVDVDLLEEKANRLRPNMDVVRSLRLTKYILSTLIYLTRGDAQFVENMKPEEAFFARRPHLAEVVRSGTDVDTVLLSLYNESPRKFIADHDPQYAIPVLLREILARRTRHRSLLGSHFHHVHSRQFEESMYLVTGAVLRLLFNVEETDTDMDIMLYLVRSRGQKPVRLKRVFGEDVKKVHQKIDHALFLLKEAAAYVLQETQRDSSFIQRILNQSFVVSALESARGVMKNLDNLDSLLAGMSKLEGRWLRLCWKIKEETSATTDELNRMMDSDVYRELLLLARDMKESGSRFFTLLQSVFGFHANLAARNKIGMTELLDRLERTLASLYTTIASYLASVPGFERQLDTFRQGHGTFTLIEEGRSEFYRTIIHEVSQVYVSFTTSTERGKLFRHHLKSLEDFDLLYDPLYGDRIKSITDPIIGLRETFPAESKFNLARFVGADPDPDAMRRSYRKIMRVRLLAEAILDFFGNPQDNGKYLFDPAAVRKESATARQHLKVIIGYCREHIQTHGQGEPGTPGGPASTQAAATLNPSAPCLGSAP